MANYVIKTWEARIRADLYCAFKSAFKGKISVSGYEFNDLAIEYPTDLKKKADLVVMANYHQGPPSPFLVIEVKRRVKHSGRSLANATKQAEIYAEKLNCRYFAVTDGFIMLLFNRTREYLINACKVEMTEMFTRNLLCGLVEYSEKLEKTILRQLPKPPDCYFLVETVLPPIARFFASKEGLTKDVVEARTSQLRASWLQILKNLNIV